MSTLAARLADLAEDAPQDPQRGPQGHHLWEQGRRFALRRRIETVGALAVVLMTIGAALAAVLPTASYEVVPSGARAELRLPDRLYDPSPWAPGTDDVGPIGPLAVLMGAERGRSGNGLVGVSAAGDYAFLDLPDLALDSNAAGKVALSEDGTRVAYWLTGATEGSPNTAAGDPVTGVAVYDTVGGSIARHALPSEHGLSVEGLAFARDTLWLDFGVLDTAARAGDESWSASDLATWTWDLDSGTVTRRPDVGFPTVGDSTSTPQGLVDLRGGRAALQLPLRPGTPKTRLRFDRTVEGPLAVSPGGRFAALRDPDGQSTSNTATKAILVGRPVDGAIATTVVPGTEVNEVWGWRDEEHVVGRLYRGNRLVSVDVETGAVESLVSLAPTSWSPGTLVAQDALQAPLLDDAPAPPYVMSPLLRWSVVGGAAVLAAALVLIWRRRRARV